MTWIDVTKLHYITGVPGKHRGARGIDDSLGKLETSFAEIFFIFFCVACLDFPRDAPFVRWGNKNVVPFITPSCKRKV